MRHFLKDSDLSHSEYLDVVKVALEFEKNPFYKQSFSGPKSVAIIFDKNSTRTRASFSTGVAQMGGYPLVIDSATSQISRGEPIKDTVRVLNGMVSAIVWRTFGQAILEEAAAFSTVPVVNALTDEFHPCQILADLSCYASLKGGVSALKGATLAYFGDGANNMAHSYLLGCATAGVNVKICCPNEYAPDQNVVEEAIQIAKANGCEVVITDDLEKAIAGVDIVTTDAWLSMGMDKSEESSRKEAFEKYQITLEVMDKANDGAVFMHCLPAYRGQEVTDEVIEKYAFSVFKEAHFRLHAQKALLAFLMEKNNDLL